MTAQEIAERIDAHLKRFEKDPEINPCQFYEDGKWYTDPTGKKGTCAFYQARAFASGRWIGVVYVAYQPSSKLTRAKAMKYLEWLDAGNVGKHFRVPE